MRFGVLGPLQVCSPTGEPVAVGGPRPRALLVMLLLDSGRVVGLDQLITGQYGDDPPAGAVNAVQAHVSRLRRSLPAGLVESVGNGYRIAADPEDVDVHRFEGLARDGRRLLATGDAAGAAPLLREALRLWRGPALVDLPHGAAQAARLTELRLSVTEDLMEAELALPTGDPVAELRQLVSTHPLRERFRGQLMRALHRAGRQAEAVAEFAAARQLLADEIGVDPSPELAATHLAILRAERPAPASRRGLPGQLTSFVGRRQELTRLDELRDARLVTILGPGGTGKTRLAIESAARRRQEVCFVDLAPVEDGGQVPQAVLAALGLRESGFQPPASDPVRRLVAALGQDLLLVLDNCEHVVAAAAALTRTLLAECPRLAILATSREPLGLTGEMLVPLAPLDVPPPQVGLRNAMAHSSVRLFAERAAAVRAGFTVGPDNVAAVVGICAALDGLPLAIELAAARLRQFPVEEISTRLSAYGRFRLLSRGDRTAAARHQTLRAVVEWSWNLLSPDEQRLARRFAVFTGGAPLVAVEAVCGVADADELLADLVDRSLVETDGTRYRMLETVRLFCVERLTEAGEQESMRRVHARYHLDLAQRADPHLRRAEQLAWLARLSAEHDNLMAALRWSARRDEPRDRRTAFRLVAALAAYWLLSGRRSQAGEIAADLLREVPDGLEEEYVSCVVHAVPRAAPQHWARARQIAHAHGRLLRHPFVVVVWGMTAGPPRDLAVAGLERLLDADDPWNAALGRFSKALLWVLGGRPADGERELRKVLDVFRALGERWGTAQTLDFLALVAGWRGEWDEAHELWAEALGLLDELGAVEEYAELLCHRAECLVRRGELTAAAADYERAADLAKAAGRPAIPPAIQLGLGEIARLRGDTREAGTRIGQVRDSIQAGTFDAESTRLAALTALGRLAETAGEATEAVRWHREALTAARAYPLTAVLAAAAEGAAGAALITGAGLRAALLLGAAVALRGTTVAGDRDVARVAAGARDLIGAAAFAQAYARGAALPHEQALTVLDGMDG